MSCKLYLFIYFFHFSFCYEREFSCMQMPSWNIKLNELRDLFTVCWNVLSLFSAFDYIGVGFIGINGYRKVWASILYFNIWNLKKKKSCFKRKFKTHILSYFIFIFRSLFPLLTMHIFVGLSSSTEKNDNLYLTNIFNVTNKP